MNLTDYEKIIKTENSAKKYLLKFCWKNHQRVCPRWRCRKVYSLASGRRRCSGCGYTFHDFSLRFLNNGNLTCGQWLRLVKLFELDISTAKMADQLSISYNTVYKALYTLRLAILSHSLDANLILGSIDGLGIGPNGKIKAAPAVSSGGRIPVFGIVERQGQVFADLIPELSVESVLHFKLNFHLRTSSLGKIVYTDSYKNYGALLLGGLPQYPGIVHQDKGLAIDASKGFWSFAKTRLRQFKGISPRNFPLYIKELEFRYNHRDQDSFPLLCRYLCSLVPNIGQ